MMLVVLRWWWRWSRVVRFVGEGGDVFVLPSAVVVGLVVCV